MMKRKNTICGLLIFLGINACSQEKPTDSIFNDTTLDEIIIAGTAKSLDQKQAKPLSTLDEFLEKSSKINMVKRGGNAWEPLTTSMATERTVIIIDGMRIFGPGTDKMDRITSYLEASIWSKVE